MKRFIFLLSCLFLISFAFTQEHTIKKIIFVPHPRSNDTQRQSSQAGIEAINFGRYDMILLGGDLTYYTTINYTAMDHCDSLYNLGDTNTLWTLGNHDMNNPGYVTEYTHRPTYYAYYIQDITFLVLNTELDVNGFVSSYISGDQLAMIHSVADTIIDSKYLVLLQHRLLWMIGNEYLETKLDSVGQSTAQLDTANFYEEVYPLLQQVKAKGIQVICLGGDRADLNIEYSPEDSITYLASTMVPEFSDTQNHVIILTIDDITDSISWEFVPLADVEKNPVDTIPDYIDNPSASDDYTIGISPVDQVITITSGNNDLNNMGVSIYDVSGKCLLTAEDEISGNSYRINWNRKGLYFIRIETNDKIITRQLFFE